MDLNSFLESRWVKAARDPRNIERVIKELPVWIEKVQNSELIERAWGLWDYLKSGNCSLADVIIVVAVLLYLISPIDAVPDFIPVAGWLDDVAIAGMVLAYLDKKACQHQISETSV